MPFLLPPEEAAKRFARAIERGVSYTVLDSTGRCNTLKAA
jgi:hypothetical protein